MKVTAFRVQNYKRILDTGWISIANLTVLVGKNEAGKSAILRGLSKLNPSDGEAYDGLKEFPRSRYTSEFASTDWPVASARLEFDADEVAHLNSLSPSLGALTSVEITRRYSGKYDIELLPKPEVSGVPTGTMRAVATQARDAVQRLVGSDGRGPALKKVKDAIVADLDAAIAELPAENVWGSSEQARKFVDAFESHINEEWHANLLEPIYGAISAWPGAIEFKARVKDAEAWVKETMPRFVYFDHYDVLESAIHIPTFLQQLANTPSAPRVRTTNALFSHVGLDLSKLAQLGAHQPGEPEAESIRRAIDERAVVVSSAGQAMTKRFTEWWEQRRHAFRYQSDGDYFRVWVSDDLDPSEIELDQRSQGMQYFFSFFLVFLVEASGQHANSVLLLDEPGNSLHGTAQARIVEFLEKIAEDGQVIYSTHSPFMIDGDHLERVRPVFEDSVTGVTSVSEDVWPKDRDALFPLQAALGYELVQSLFISRKQVIVEGMTDYWLLKSLAEAVAARGGITLDADIVITPAAGASKALPLASMMAGHGVELAALFDGDEPGRADGKKLLERLLHDSKRVKYVADFVAGNETAELEDLFGDYYLSAVAVAYPGVKLTFDTDEATMPNIVDRLTALFARNGKGQFEKWRAAAALRDTMLADPAALPDEVLERANAVFGSLNAAFE